jgi:hypothetical protein
MKREYSIIGDNIVECLRFVALASTVLEAQHKEIESGSLYVRLFRIDTLGDQYFFYLYPGHNRWGTDIIDQFTQCGLMLKEAPDALIAIRQDGREFPILSLEFCSALSAGNQAWQRHGRALALSLIGLPYIFITHIGGNELDSKREKRSLRFPNPTVPLSFFSFSKRNPKFLSAYLQTPDFFHNEGLFNGYNIIDRTKLSQLIKSYLHLNPDYELHSILASKNLDFAKLILNKQKGEEAKKMLSSLGDGQTSDIDFLRFITTKYWNKKISIPIKQSLKEIRSFLNNHAKGIISNDLPFCVLPQGDIANFIKKINDIYGVTLPKTLLNEDFLVICFIAGFKPKGDDSRPDRGLIPFVRMLLGLEKKLISFVYGPIKPDIFAKIKVDPQSQNQTNGLWQAVNSLSNYVILDPSSVKDKFLIWENPVIKKQKEIELSWIIPSNVPTKTSEHDVDSFVNKLFTTKDFFEGLCNPPGGDWAGISLPNREFSKELRWTSLPRVTRSSKRPDHIYAKRNNTGVNVYIIESKERSSNVESDIGKRLIDYVRDLLIYLPSAERIIGEIEWQEPSQNVLWAEDYRFYSGFCSFDDRLDKEDFSIFKDNHIDFVILFSRSDNPKVTFKSFNTNCDVLAELIHLIV